MAVPVSPKFASHLDQWGPGGEVCTSLAAAEDYCRTMATSHYENFPVASVVLPRRLRQPMSNVYAFCRWADDLGDEVLDSEKSLELLAWWREETRRCFSGEASHPVFVALQKSIADHTLKRQPFEDLISAFEQDQRVSSYNTFDELEDYCRRSANPVGRIVLRLLDSDTTNHVRLSDEVCTGLQLINFWQDVARDADIGRNYLPAADCDRFGYTEEMRVSRLSNSEFHSLMKFEVDRARELLLSSKPLARGLRGRLRVAIDLFGRGGLAICNSIERIEYDVWSKRPTVSKWQGMQLFGRSLIANRGGFR